MIKIMKISFLTCINTFIFSFIFNKKNDILNFNIIHFSGSGIIFKQLIQCQKNIQFDKKKIKNKNLK